MSCPPGQSFDDILQECVTHNSQDYAKYKALDCKSKNMFYNGLKCVSPYSQAGKDLFDDFADGVQDPKVHGNEALFKKMMDHTRRTMNCPGTENMSTRELVNTFVLGDTCFDVDYLIELLQSSFNNNEPFFVKNRFGDYYYPTAKEVYELYKHHVRKKQRRNLPVIPMPVIQVDKEFIQSHELKFFVTPYTQRFIHIALMQKSDHVVKTVGFIPRIKPFGLPAQYNVDNLLVLIKKAYSQGRLVNSAYEKRIKELPDTSDPWNKVDATKAYVRLFEMMKHVTRYLRMSRVRA